MSDNFGPQTKKLLIEALRTEHDHHVDFEQLLDFAEGLVNDEQKARIQEACSRDTDLALTAADLMRDFAGVRTIHQSGWKRIEAAVTGKFRRDPALKGMYDSHLERCEACRRRDKVLVLQSLVAGPLVVATAALALVFLVPGVLSTFASTSGGPAVIIKNGPPTKPPVEQSELKTYKNPAASELDYAINQVWKPHQENNPKDRAIKIKLLSLYRRALKEAAPTPEQKAEWTREAQRLETELGASK